MTPVQSPLDRFTSTLPADTKRAPLSEWIDAEATVKLILDHIKTDIIYSQTDLF